MSALQQIFQETRLLFLHYREGKEGMSRNLIKLTQLFGHEPELESRQSDFKIYKILL